MNIVLLLAGGAGSRMGSVIPKQFLQVAGEPVIVHTMRVLENNRDIDKIVAVCIDGWEKKLRGYADKAGISKLFNVVSGGENRYKSTRHGMESLDVNDDDVIVVHDAARPMVTDESLSDVICVCREHGNSMAVIDCVDTMYAREDGGTSQVLERSMMVRGQTPEAVTGKRMRDMYRAADKKKIHDDSISALQVALGWKVYFAKGSEQNIKMTRPTDLKFFEMWLVAQKRA
ncbi:IspD/TarI family cytidylyltransferase [Schwartzia succinivorans]|uniref:2-C-methyl-D-erythritol 4-phosphate cytidylyltransferase n=1 Tax=Schwartzia succinivorans DSM 10502 TaxID=1123243 RepID=A0A1M4SNM1_9FIRM|nr:IspD/TarI family cytidylyltransferase [Schwartzia succinivorans]SHE33762.1 2-C-methyl-D-erythritol 4-phosphate cytidylyltransferase [Schwartzia succinivorans DSM 10502]